MGFLDKDIHQKEKAIRFCLANGLVPFLEVDVQNFRELSDTNTIVTDLDVLGVKIDSSGRPRRVIFDCKTAKVSPINRAFWASGVMQYTDCDEAFALLRKRASEAHRLSAKTINVHLFDDAQFDNYAESCSLNYPIDYCYTSSINSWKALYQASRGNPKIEYCYYYISVFIPLDRECDKALRKLLGTFQKASGELDPGKNKHRAVFFMGVASLAFVLSQIIHDLRNIIDFDATGSEFEKVLKYYVWGGRDSFRLRNKLRSAFNGSNSAIVHEEAELKGWPEFTELCRNLLDSPSDIQKCVHPLREIAMRSVMSSDVNKDADLSRYIAENKRIRQFIIQMAKYFVLAAKLPKDFVPELEYVFDQLR
jgi:hypothetical protein